MDLQIHFFSKWDQKNDLHVKVELIKAENAFEELENYLISKKWEDIFPNDSTKYEKNKNSILFENTLLEGINNLQNYVQGLIFTNKKTTEPGISKHLISDSIFCWIIIGKIQNLNINDLINQMESLVKQSAEISVDNTLIIPGDGIKTLDGYGTYFYPPIWVGEIPKLSFIEKVHKRSIFSEKIIDIYYKGKILIIENDGFICVGESNKKEAITILNEIMASAVFVGTPAFMINEVELSKVKIDLKDKTIIQKITTINSMRTKLGNQWDQNPFTDRTLFLSKKKLVDLFKASELLTSDEDLKNFLLFYLESFTHIQNYLYSQSFLISWLIVERYLSLLWEKEVVEKVENNKRKKKLKNSVRWSSDYIIESLNFLGVISNDNYKKLMKLKKKRNRIVHNGEGCTKEEAENCLDISNKILMGGLEPS